LHNKKEKDGSHVIALLDTCFIQYFLLFFSHSYVDAAVVVKFSDDIDEGKESPYFSGWHTVLLCVGSNQKLSQDLQKDRKFQGHGDV